MRNRKMRKKNVESKRARKIYIKYTLDVDSLNRKKCKINKMNEITNQNYVLPEHAQCLRVKLESNIEQHEPKKTTHVHDTIATGY